MAKCDFSTDQHTLPVGSQWKTQKCCLNFCRIMPKMWHLLFNPFGHLRWWAKQGYSNLGGVLRTPKTLRALIQNSQAWDVYVQLNPSKELRYRKLPASKISYWSTILIDIDPISESAEPLLAAEVITAALRDLLQAPALSPTIIDSGRGVQLWLSVPPLAINDDAHRKRIRSSVGALLWSLKGCTPTYGCTVDTSTSDLARVARMPDTINQKTGRRARIISEGDGLSANGIAEKILALAPIEPSIPPAYSGPPLITVGWQQAAHYMSGLAKDYLVDGVPEPGRHKAAYATAAALRDVGMPLEEATALVLSGAERCSPPLSMHDAHRAARCAYSSGVQKGMI
jgi:hypothetical protein